MRPPTIRPHLIAALAAFLLLVCAPAPARATRAAADAYQVKSGFLMNFLKFVEWDVAKVPVHGAPFVVVIYGDTDFAVVASRAVSRQLVLGRPVIVRAAADVDGVRDAHLLFIASEAQPQLATLVRTFEGRGTLTVGDTPGFAEAGVVLNLYVAGDRMRFEVNTAAAARARVRLSSQLLKLARLVG